MSDIIYYKNGEEIYRISPPTIGTKCPETKLEITMTEIEKVRQEIKVLEKKLALLEEVEKYRSPAEEAYKDWCGQYPSGSPSEDVKWGAFLAGYQATQPKAVPVDDPPEYDEVEWDEKDNPASYMTDEVVNRMLKKWEENPPEFLKFELGKTLEDLIARWWLDTHTDHKDWDVPTCVDDLVDQIQLWLPREQSAEGSQNVDTMLLVDGFNDCLNKIKSKLRNKR